MQVKLGCEFVYEATQPTPMTLLVRPRDRANHILLHDKRVITPDIPVHDFTDFYGNHLWRLTAPPGQLRIYYDALAQVPPTPDPALYDLPGHLVQDLPDEALHFLLPSRHVQSDLVISDAWRLFGSTTPGWLRVQAI